MKRFPSTPGQSREKGSEKLLAARGGRVDSFSWREKAGMRGKWSNFSHKLWTEVQEERRALKCRRAPNGLMNFDVLIG